MNFISQFLFGIGDGIAAFLPKMGSAIFDTFVSLFFTVGEAGAIGELNVLGQMGVAFIVIGMGIKFIPKIIGWLSLSWSNRRKRRAARGAK